MTTYGPTPHVPSLTIDLAASSDTARLREVDEAVIGTIQESARSTGWWGIRVLDSVHRTGDLPRGRLAQLMSDSRGARSLTWSRYRPAGPRSSASGEKPQRSNMRLLQDSGAEVRCKPAGTSAAQVAGGVPAATILRWRRRRGCGGIPSSGPRAHGLVSVRRRGRRRRETTRTQLSSASAYRRATSWTGSGLDGVWRGIPEPGRDIRPSRRADRPGRSRGDRVLWEWRPPYLQGSTGHNRPASVRHRREGVPALRIQLPGSSGT